MAGIRTDGPISDAAGTGPATLTKQSAAKAFSQMNQAAGTSLVSFNISSITDSAVGSFYANLTTSMAAGDYAVAGCQEAQGYSSVDFSYNLNSGQMRLTQINLETDAFQDSTRITAVAFGDLA